jgi:hypothetical protein
VTVLIVLAVWILGALLLGAGIGRFLRRSDRAARTAREAAPDDRELQPLETCDP